MARIAPDPKERPRQAKTRLLVFGFIIALSALVMGATLLFGPLFDPEDGTGLTALIAVPAGIAVAFVAFIVYLFVQLRRH